MNGRFWDTLFVLSYVCLIISFILAFTNIVEYWYLALVLYFSAPICVFLVVLDLIEIVKRKELKP